MVSETGSSRGRRWVLALGALLVVVAVLAPVSGGIWERLASGVRPRVHAAGYGLLGQGIDLGGWLEMEIADWVDKILVDSFRPPISARITPPGGGIWDDVPGLHVDVARTRGDILSAGPGDLVTVKTVEMSPFLTGDMLRGLTHDLGGFSTWGMGGGPRNYNLYLGAVFIDWTLVLPGEVFSFWEQVGVPTYERGFEPAPVIVGGSIAMAPGGGLCQVSTTLYNAVLKAGLEVIERHPHTMPVGYVGPGMDAAVAWDYLDLKFKNTSPWPIVVRMGYAGGLLWARILGPQPPEA